MKRIELTLVMLLMACQKAATTGRESCASTFVCQYASTVSFADSITERTMNSDEGQ